jgi:hypothetical protein
VGIQDFSPIWGLIVCLRAGGRSIRSEIDGGDRGFVRRMLRPYGVVGLTLCGHGFVVGLQVGDRKHCVKG